MLKIFSKKLPKAILIHGWDGGPEKNWFPWFAQQLAEIDYFVINMSMPNSHSPACSIWVKHLQAPITPDRHTIIIAHSIGCMAALKFVEKINTQIAGMILVSAFTENEKNYKTIKSLRREPKMYLWDWSQVENEGARFENIIASHLLKTVHYFHDREGYKIELFFLRDIEKREVDFLLTVDKKPWLAVETKLSAKEVSKPLEYFSAKLNIPFSYQVIRESNVDFRKGSIRVISADKFLSGLV